MLGTRRARAYCISSRSIGWAVFWKIALLMTGSLRLKKYMFIMYMRTFYLYMYGSVFFLCFFFFLIRSTFMRKPDWNHKKACYFWYIHWKDHEWSLDQTDSYQVFLRHLTLTNRDCDLNCSDTSKYRKRIYLICIFYQNKPITWIPSNVLAYLTLRP